MSIRQYALIKVNHRMKSWLIENEVKDSPLLSEDHFVYLGEIPNMPGHCVVAGKTSGKLLSGVHLDSFVELDNDEL